MYKKQTGTFLFGGSCIWTYAGPMPDQRIKKSNGSSGTIDPTRTKEIKKPNLTLPTYL